MNLSGFCAASPEQCAQGTLEIPQAFNPNIASTLAPYAGASAWDSATPAAQEAALQSQPWYSSVLAGAGRILVSIGKEVGCSEMLGIVTGLLSTAIAGVPSISVPIGGTYASIEIGVAAAALTRIIQREYCPSISPATTSPAPGARR